MSNYNTTLEDAMDKQEFDRLWKQVIIKAWSDADFKKKLILNPEKTLNEFGIKVPKDETVVISEESATSQKTWRLVIPRQPASGELSTEALDKVAAAGGGVCCNG